MINQIIEEILEIEKQADAIIDQARERAKDMLSNNAANIDRLYENAEIQLKRDVEYVLLSAEKKAEEEASIMIDQSKKQTAKIIEKAGLKFDGATKRVEDALKGE